MKTVFVERLTEKDGAWIWDPQAEKLDLEGDFSVDEGNLDRELCRMGQILVRYATLAGELQAELKRKEEHVKFVQAQTSGLIRATNEANGTKATEGKLNEAVTVHTAYQDALRDLHILRANAISADHWYRSAVKKSDLLTALAYRQTAELKRT